MECWRCLNSFNQWCQSRVNLRSVVGANTPHGPEGPVKPVCDGFFSLLVVMSLAGSLDT